MKVGISCQGQGGDSEERFSNEVSHIVGFPELVGNATWLEIAKIAQDVRDEDLNFSRAVPNAIDGFDQA